MRVSFPVASDKGHDTHLASYTIAENKLSLGEIKIAGRDKSSLKNTVVCLGQNTNTVGYNVAFRRR